MSHQFFNNLENKPKLIPHNRSISGVGRGILTPVGECFISVQIGSKVFRDRVIVIKNLQGNYIQGQVFHGDNKFGTGYSTNGRHYIILNGEMLAQSCSQLATSQLLKT